MNFRSVESRKSGLYYALRPVLHCFRIRRVAVSEYQAQQQRRPKYRDQYYFSILIFAHEADYKPRAAWVSIGGLIPGAYGGFILTAYPGMLRMQAGHGRRFRSTRCFMCPGYKLLIRPGPVDSGNPYPLSPLSRHPWRSIPIVFNPATKQRPHSNGARCLCPHICARP